MKIRRSSSARLDQWFLKITALRRRTTGRHGAARGRLARARPAPCSATGSAAAEGAVEVRSHRRDRRAGRASSPRASIRSTAPRFVLRRLSIPLDETSQLRPRGADVRGVRRVGSRRRSQTASRRRREAGCRHRTLRDQSVQRRESPDLGRQLRAHGIRDWRHHGACPRTTSATSSSPASTVSCASSRSCARSIGALAGRRMTRPFRREDGCLRPVVRAGQRQAPPSDDASTPRAEASARAPCSSASRTGASRASATGARRSRSIYCADVRRSCRCRTRTCRSCCRETSIFAAAATRRWRHVPEFVNVACPKCGGAGAARDRHDGHVRRFVLVLLPLTATRRTTPRRSIARRSAAWFPIDLYIGGIEHATLHLIYCRFFTKFMRGPRAGDASTSRSTNLLTQGMVVVVQPLLRGAPLPLPRRRCVDRRDRRSVRAQLCVRCGRAVQRASSRRCPSRRTTFVDPDAAVERYGADAIRIFALFASPPDSEVVWTEQGMEGAYRFPREGLESVERHGDALKAAADPEPAASSGDWARGEASRLPRRAALRPPGGARIARSSASRTTSPGGSSSTRRSPRSWSC